MKITLQNDYPTARATVERRGRIGTFYCHYGSQWKYDYDNCLAPLWLRVWLICATWWAERPERVEARRAEREASKAAERKTFEGRWQTRPLPEAKVRKGS